MILSAQNLTHYLLERELVPPSAVVDGEWMVVSASSRHKNFKVMQGTGGVFVKQAQPEDAQARSTLEREAMCYWLAEHHPDFQGLKAVLPGQRFFDAQSGVLVLELLPGENLSEFHRRTGLFPVEVAGKLGAALGSYHRQVRVPPVNDGQTGRVFPRMVPWVLNSAQLASMHAAGQSGGATQLMELVGRFPEFARTLEALRAGWRQDSLIHGDMKWENCLVVTAADSAVLDVRVVDWEMADFGDACWDVGAIFQSYLTLWLSSLPFVAGQSAASVLHLAQFPIERMQASMNAYWQAYVSARGLSGGVVGETLERSVQYAAARMIQTAYEHLYRAPALAPHTLSMMQVSLNVLLDPRSAIRDLLELRAVA